MCACGLANFPEKVTLLLSREWIQQILEFSIIDYLLEVKEPESVTGQKWKAYFFSGKDATSFIPRKFQAQGYCAMMIINKSFYMAHIFMMSSTHQYRT